jgi:hypothetical protein
VVLIITSFGATKNYPNPEMMRRTFGAFLESLRRQTDPRFHLFISHHDRPDIPAGDPWIHWCSVSIDANHQGAVVPAALPKTAKDAVEWKRVCCGGKNTDMGRKTINSAYEAGRWAFGVGLKGFWMLRMDSDDLLWEGAVEYLHSLPPAIRAVYSRRCHLIDFRLGEMGEQVLPYSATCNALRYSLSDSGVFDPEWFYHCRDHTTFIRTVHEDGIPAAEKDCMLCIATNSGNHISARPGIAGELNASRIPGTPDLAERYGLDAYLSRA